MTAQISDIYRYNGRNYDLVFEHGKVVRKINHSKIVEGIRKKINEDPEFDEMRGDIIGFIQESFSLDAKVKAWWI